jgi:hypothetical protein
MSDWEVFANTEAQLLAVVKSMGLWHLALMRGSVVRTPEGILAQGVLKSGTQYFFNYYKTKMVPSGKNVRDPWGRLSPEMVPAAGVWGTLRWLSTDGSDPPAIDPASGVTINPLPANAYNTLAS